jgi:hypothetical protein
MKREDYKNYEWYDVTDDTYWTEELPEEFPNTFTIVCEEDIYGNKNIYTYSSCFIGWGSMAKFGGFKFMICQKPV